MAPVTTPERKHAWANAMLQVAENMTAGLRNLPPAQRKAALIRASALTGTANGLLSGTGLPPKRGAYDLTPNR